jgi:hypothetical protein
VVYEILNLFVLDIQKPETLYYVLGIVKELLIPHIKENNRYQGGDCLGLIKSNHSDHQVKSSQNQNPVITLTGIKV